jgi:hypothetical protein
LRRPPRHRWLGDRCVDFASLVAKRDAAIITLSLITALVLVSFALGYLLGYEASSRGHQWKP